MRPDTAFRQCIRFGALFVTWVMCAGMGSAFAQILSTPNTLYLIAGGTLGSNLTGTGPAAQFTGPTGVVRNQDGNLYVADTGNNVVRKIAADGSTSVFAGTGGLCGFADSTATSPASAQFCGPVGIAADAAGNLYVADMGNHAIRKITPAGFVTTIAGTPAMDGYVDQVGSSARFASPAGVAVDAAGNIYVADQGNQVIRRISQPDATVSTYAGTQYNGTCQFSDGAGSNARFCFPIDVAVDATGVLYVADTGNSVIRKVAMDRTVSTIAGTVYDGFTACQFADGAALNVARFCLPTGVKVDAAGTVFVADNSNNTIRKFRPDAGTAYHVSTVAGAAGSDFDTLGQLPGTIFIPFSIQVIGGNQLAFTTRNHEILGANLEFLFSGFLHPVASPPTLNLAKAGSAIPVKFSVGGDKGTGILMPGSPWSQQVYCDSSLQTSSAVQESTVTAGNNSLSYDPTSDQYSYVWKTDKSWAGQCRMLSLGLVDGKVYTAQFKFEK